MPVPVPVARLHIFQLSTLRFGKIRGYFLMCVSDEFAHALAGILPDLFELRGGFVDDRGDFGDLLGR